MSNFIVQYHVDMINIPLNGKGKSKLIDNAIKEATEKGIAVVVSAGNDGEDTKEYIPSSTKEAIVVSSKDTNMSNHGDEIDYCAEDSYVGEKGSVSVGTSYSAAYVTASVAKVLEKTTLPKDKDRVKNLQLELDRFTSKVEESNIKSEETEKYFGRGYLEPNKITDELIAQYENELGFAKLKEKAKKEEKKAKQNTDKSKEKTSDEKVNSEVNTDDMNLGEEPEEVIRLKASGSPMKKIIQFQIYDAGDASSFGVQWLDDRKGQNEVYREVSMPNQYGYNFDNKPMASSIPGGGVIQVNMHPELDHIQYKSSLKGTNTLTVYYGGIESSVIDGHGVTPYFWMNTVKNGAEPVMIKDYTDKNGFPRFSNGADDNTNGRGTQINGRWKYSSKWDRRWSPEIKRPSGGMFQIYMYTGVGFYEAHQRIFWWSSHNVHYDGNGGEYPGGAPSDFTKESGQTPNISSKIPQKHGYDFEGYNITGEVKGSLNDQKRDGKGLVHPNEAYTHDQNGCASSRIKIQTKNPNKKSE